MSGMYSKRVSTVVSTIEESSVSLSPTQTLDRDATSFRHLDLSPFALRLGHGIHQWTSQTENIFKTTKSSLLTNDNLNTGHVWQQTRMTVDYKDLDNSRSSSASSPPLNGRERLAKSTALLKFAHTGNVQKSKPGTARRASVRKRAGKGKRSKQNSTKLTAAKVLFSDVTPIISAAKISSNRTKKQVPLEKLRKQKSVCNKAKLSTNKIALSSPVKSARRNNSLSSNRNSKNIGKGNQINASKLFIKKNLQKSSEVTTVASKSEKIDGQEYSMVFENNMSNFPPAASFRNVSTQKTSAQIEASGKVEAANNSPKLHKNVKKMKIKNNNLKQGKSTKFKKSNLGSKTYKKEISKFSRSKTLNHGEATRKGVNSDNSSSVSLQVDRSNFRKGKAEATEISQLRKSKTRKQGVIDDRDKSSVKYAGNKSRQIETAGNSQAGNSKTLKSNSTKSSKLKSSVTEKVSPFKSDQTKCKTVKKANGKLLHRPNLLSATRFSARGRSLQNLQFYNFSTCNTMDIKDAAVDEKPVKSGKEARKEAQPLPRKKERKISNVTKSGNKRPMRKNNKNLLSVLKKNLSPSRRVKKKCAKIRKTESVSVLGVPVEMYKRRFNDDVDFPHRKRSIISRSTILKKGRKSAPTKRQNSITHHLVRHASKSSTRKKRHLAEVNLHKPTSNFEAKLTDSSSSSVLHKPISNFEAKLTDSSSSSVMPKVLSKNSKKSLTSSSKSTPKILLSKKLTKLRQLKKDHNKMSRTGIHKTSSLSSFPQQKKVFLKSVNVNSRLTEFESSQKTAPRSAVARREVFFLPPMNKVGKLFTTARKTKVATLANTKKLRSSIVLRMKKSLPPASKTVFGLSDNKEATDFDKKQNTDSLSTVHATKSVSLLNDSDFENSTINSKGALTFPGKIEKISSSKFQVKENSKNSSPNVKVWKNLISASAQIVENKSGALCKRPHKNKSAAELTCTKKSRKSDSPTPKQSSTPIYLSHKITNRSDKINLLGLRKTPKLLVAKKSQKQKSNHKKSLNKKHTELTQPKKTLKEVRVQRKSLRLSLSPVQSASSQSFVKSLESDSSLNETTIASVAVKKKAKKLSSSSIKKGVSKLSTMKKKKKKLALAKQKSSRLSTMKKKKKELTLAKQKSSRLSTVLRLNKSYKSVAPHTVVQRPSIHGVTDLIQMQKSVNSPSLKGRLALTIRKKMKKTDSNIGKVTPKQSISRKKLKSPSEDLSCKKSIRSLQSRKRLLPRATEITPKQSISKLQNISVTNLLIRTGKQSELFHFQKEPKRVGSLSRKKLSSSCVCKISSHPITRLCAKSVASVPSLHVAASRSGVSTMNIAALSAKKGVKKLSTVMQQTSSQTIVKKQTRISSNRVKGLQSLLPSKVRVSKRFLPALKRAKRTRGLDSENNNLFCNEKNNTLKPLVKKQLPIVTSIVSSKKEFSVQKNNTSILKPNKVLPRKEILTLSANIYANTTQSQKLRRTRHSKASNIKTSLAFPQHNQLTKPLLNRKQLQKDISPVTHEIVGKKFEISTKDGANEISGNKTVKVHTSNTPLGIIQTSWRNITSTSPKHLGTTYTNAGMASPSQVHRGTNLPSRGSDISNTEHANCTTAARWEMAETSLGRSDLLYSELGRKSLPSSYIMDPDNSQPAKSILPDLNLAMSSPAKLGVVSYTRDDMISPTSISRTQAHTYTFSMGRKDRAVPSLVEKDTTTLMPWTKDVRNADHQRNDAPEVASSSTISVDDYQRYRINSPSSVEVKSRFYTELSDPVVKDTSRKQSPVKSRHSIVTDVRNIVLNNSVHIKVSNDKEKYSFIDNDSKKNRFKAEDEETSNEIAETENSEELKVCGIENMNIKEEDSCNFDTIDNHSTYSQHCTIL